jgi:hypothetical protein
MRGDNYLSAIRFGSSLPGIPLAFKIKRRLIESLSEIPRVETP